MYSTEDALAILIAKSDLMVVSLRELVVETKRHNAEMERMLPRPWSVSEPKQRDFAKLQSDVAEEFAKRFVADNHLDVTARYYGLVRQGSESDAELLKRIDLYKLRHNT